MTGLIGPALLSLAGVVALVFAREYGLWSYGAPAAGLMPATAGALLLVASVIDLRSSAHQGPRPAIAWRPLSYIAGLVTLVPLTPLIGLLPALAMFIFAVLHFVERLTVLRATAVAAGAVAGSWILFERLLSVPLPKSLF